MWRFILQLQKIQQHDLHGGCGSEVQILECRLGASGRRGDGNVFFYSAFGRRLRKGLLNLPPPLPCDGFSEDLPFFFVGDAAFSGNPHIIAPKKGKFLHPEEVLSNYRISRARRVIENALGSGLPVSGFFWEP